MRRAPRSCARVALAVLVACVLAACDAEPPPARDLPKEWYAAQTDPAKGGRYRPERAAELARFQAGVLASGEPVPYPHYAPSGTVVLAIKSDFIASGTRRRLATLLEHETTDPELSIVALTDRSAEEIEGLLGPLPGAERVTLIPIEGDGPEHATFQFVRDYAPLVRVVPSDGALRAAGLVLYQGSTLNKVVDARLGVRINRAAKTTRDKFALSKALAALYAERLGRELPVETTALRMDGGNLVSDGRGTCFATHILLAKNRDDRRFVEGELREKLGCRRVTYLSAPQRLDFIQHVDTMLAFADPENVVLSMPVLYESDKIREFQNVRTLLELGYKVHRVPRRTASITYTNVLVTRHNVYLPQYGVYAIESPGQLALNERLEALDRAGRRDLVAWYRSRPVARKVVEGDPALAEDNRVALDVMTRVFPDRRIVPVESDETLRTQGSWHCLSHELPDRL